VRFLAKKRKMAGEDVAQQLEAQKELVRKLKTEKAPKDEIDAAVAKLKELKVAAGDAAPAAKGKGKGKAEEKPDPEREHRTKLEEMLRRRFWIAPAYQLYGGVAGLYDFGPAGCALKANLINLWKQHFILEEGMFEVECTAITPEEVLKTSGHVEKFCDFMVKDKVDGTCYRADKLLEERLKALLKDPDVEAGLKEEYELLLNKVDALTQEELGNELKKLCIKSDNCNDLTDPFEFNLMFGTMIGPEGTSRAFLRPETAQGIFLNFKRLTEFSGGKFPFAAAQVGNAYRNEISPRAGLLRVREFQMAEIEHFFDAESGGKHDKFENVKDVKIALFSANAQLRKNNESKVVTMTVGEAVESGMIENETLGYYVARTYLFLRMCGIHEDKVRFRQHLPTEMAHYARDCWDAELHTTYGWIEAVGHADRSAYDLKVHANRTKTDLSIWKTFDVPQHVDVMEAKVNKGVLGKVFRKEAKEIIEYLGSLSTPGDEAGYAEAEKIENDLASNGECVVNVRCGQAATTTITREMVSFAKKTKKISGRSFIPHVVEPSFGLGRIIYAILEQNFVVREGGDDMRAVVAVPPVLAPIKVAVLPQSANAAFEEPVKRIMQALTGAGITHRDDSSSVSIGKKYTRFDELGTPFAVTIDFTTPEDDTVTLRERDSCQQIRIRIDRLASVVKRLSDGSLSWTSAKQMFPVVENEAEKQVALSKESDAPALQGSDLLESYLEKHGVHSLFHDLLNKVAEAKPDDPKAFILKELQKN